MTVLEALVRDIAVYNVKFVGKEGHSVSFTDGMGKQHTLRLKKGINDRVTFDYKGASYYIASIDVPQKGSTETLMAFRLCDDVLVSARPQHQSVYSINMFQSLRFYHWEQTERWVKHSKPEKC